MIHSGWKAAALLAIVFALETGLSLIDSITFRHFLGLTPADLSAIASGVLVRDLVAAMWPRFSGEEK